MANSDDRLPDCLVRPYPDLLGQAYLFLQSTDEALAELKVSRDEVRHWQSKNWISFDIDALSKVDDPLICEIRFVRNLARSGLSDALINQFLKGLPTPY